MSENNNNNNKESTTSHSGGNKRFAVLTSGGDSCGMNPAIRAFVRASLLRGAKVFAIREGYNGLVTGSIVELDWQSVGGIISRGGTIIGTARSAEFRTREGRKIAVFNLLKNKIDNLLVIGGDGSLTGANILRCEWNSLVKELVDDGKLDQSCLASHPTLNIAGLAGSIDNDMCGTDFTIGADTATKRILEAVDAILSTAVSHQRSFIIEVMGRNCGWLALVSGVSTGADYILVPEIPPEEGWEQSMKENLEKGRLSGRRCSLVIVAEGAIDRQGKPITSNYVKKVLEDAGHDARITILGHVQRGGVPTFLDRYIATRMGMDAAEYFFECKEGSEPVFIGIRGLSTITRLPLMQCVVETQSVGELIKQHKFMEAVKVRGILFEQFHEIFMTCSNLKRKQIDPKIEKKNFLILHSGGPSPGMNPAVRAFTRLGLDKGHNLYGVFNGFSGIAKEEIQKLDWMTVNGWAVMGGAELGTNRTVPNDQNIKEIVQTLVKYRIDGILMFGGYNGYIGASNLYQYRNTYPELKKISIICAPGTIANNVPGTDVSVGSDTCLNNILDALDKIKQSAVASRRLFVVEVMGAHCGYLCTMASLTSGAEQSYTMEKGITIDSLTEDLKMFVERFKREHKIGLIIKSENASSTYTTHFIYSLFKEEGKHLFDVRESILGHLQQGGSPSGLDRLVSARFMRYYFELIDNTPQLSSNLSGCIGSKNGRMTFTPMDEMVQSISPKFRRPIHQWWLDLIKQSQEISVAPLNLESNETTPKPISPLVSPTIYAQKQFDQNVNPQHTI
ncbi:6-phosphofructokinase [Tieghemostelium lacteum]|uniref:6-phosphofructokinase n=1 Tax=Tieghemostelium lacteum TaxID=361077 RepID=A0A151ZEY1_TIELA|nr:6-phosphofructokinase [Tieghemostelium lacteum]|eukprot:KYQ92477.1 6-phosphofructokinase [Tieghemostelium lacteum]